MRKTSAVLSVFCILFVVDMAFAQDDDDEPTLRVNGYIQTQTGVFVPLGLDGIFNKDRAFQDHKNRAYEKITLGGSNDQVQYDSPCDPAVTPTRACQPVDHGGRAGSASMLRGTLQLEADWTPFEELNIHGVLQGVRALALSQDYWAQPPKYFDVEDRPQWVLDNQYNRFDLREIYLDYYMTDNLSFRIGRQQVTWGETGQYRLLDVINPVDTTWHFGPLESFQDTRIPLWIAKMLIEFPAIEHNLELVWVPGFDRPEDSVTVPLSFVGAWGLPATNTPSPFMILEKKFMYPSQDMPDSMRGGFRWKGNLGKRISYSLVYYYTHQLSPPVPVAYDLAPVMNPTTGEPFDGIFDNDTMKTLYLDFPRQHITGFTFEYTFDNPIGMVAKLETAIEPDRTFPRTSTSPNKTVDMNYENYTQRYQFNPVQKPVISYAVVLMRPTMIRWLNPTQNFLFLVQWMHTIIPDISDVEAIDLVNIPGFNDYTIKTHSWKLVGVMRTSYFHGFFTPKVVGAYVHPQSGFVTTAFDFRIKDHWRVQLSLTDFFGKDPYRAVGLLRDRDEVNLRVRFQF